MNKMEIHGVNLDVQTNQPVILLRDTSTRRLLPIWIGQFEATAILMEMQGIKPSRPLTHDLLKTVLDRLEAQIKRIVISDLREGTFFAEIHLSTDGSSFVIDARPSDAIALAVRAQIPIFAEDVVLEQASIDDEHDSEAEVERFREFIETVSPEDFLSD